MGEMELEKVVLIVGVLFSLTSYIEGQVSGTLPACDFPAIYNFGDANSDTGGISATLAPIPPPYGESFFQKPAGRKSDGRLIIDFIAEHLGLPYLSAYLDSIGPNFRRGANFATGGSTILRPNETIFENGMSPFSLDIQTMLFDQFKVRTRDLYEEAKNSSDSEKLPRPREFSRALYILDIGQGDLAAGFQKYSDAQLGAMIPVMINQLAAAVQHLYHHGARAFWIHNTGPVGCLPIVTMRIGSPKPGFLDNFGCIRGWNDMAMEFNRQLKARVIKLRAELPHAALTYVDVYAAKYNLISKAEKLGFTSPHKICCGHFQDDAIIWCGQRGMVNGTEVYGGACANPSTYVNWDGMHYSQAANHWISSHILDGSLSDPPIPITLACHKHVHL